MPDEYNYPGGATELYGLMTGALEHLNVPTIQNVSDEAIYASSIRNKIKEADRLIPQQIRDYWHNNGIYADTRPQRFVDSVKFNPGIFDENPSFQYKYRPSLYMADRDIPKIIPEELPLRKIPVRAGVYDIEDPRAAATNQTGTQAAQRIANDIQSKLNEAPNPNAKLAMQRSNALTQLLSRARMFNFLNPLAIISGLATIKNPDPADPIGQFFILSNPEQYPEQYSRLQDAMYPPT